MLTDLIQQTTKRIFYNDQFKICTFRLTLDGDEPRPPTANGDIDAVYRPPAAAHKVPSPVPDNQGTHFRIRSHFENQCLAPIHVIAF